MNPINITGNVIPLTWYHTILKPNGKPYMNAISVLAELVFWHKPVYENGKYRNKFKGEQFKIDYNKLSKLLNLTEKDIQRSLVYLEKENLISKEIKRKPFNNKIISVLYIKVNFERLEEINNFEIIVDNSVDNSVD